MQRNPLFPRPFSRKQGAGFPLDAAAWLFGYLAMRPPCFAAAILHETIRLRQLVRNRFSAARIAQLHVRHLLGSQHPPAFLAARKRERAVPDGARLGVLHERDATRGTNVCAAQTPNAIVARRTIGSVYLLVDAAVDRGDGPCSHALACLHAQPAQDALTRPKAQGARIPRPPPCKTPSQP